MLEDLLFEADDIIKQLSKLVDVSRNKPLQRKLLKFAESSHMVFSDQVGYSNDQSQLYPDQNN